MAEPLLPPLFYRCSVARPVSPWPPQRAAGAGDGSSLEHPAADPAPAHPEDEGRSKEVAGDSSVAEHPPLELPAAGGARPRPHPHPLAHALRSSLLRVQLGSGSGPGAPPPAAPLQEAEGRGIRRRRGHGEGEHQRGARKKRSSCISREIYVALKAIRPGLARPELMRAYSALIRDERQFRSLMALPEEMRRDWLLMEIGSMQR